MIVKLFLQRDTSELYARFEVLDEKGAPKYLVRGKQKPSGESLRIRDLHGAIVCKIRRLGFHTFSAYSISVGCESVRLNIALSGGAALVRFRGISFVIRGDVMAGNYDILDVDHSVVCAVSKDFAKRALTLTIDMAERELFCIAAAVCIDSLSMTPLPALQMI